MLKLQQECHNDQQTSQLMLAVRPVWGSKLSLAFNLPCREMAASGGLERWIVRAEHVLERQVRGEGLQFVP